MGRFMPAVGGIDERQILGVLPSCFHRRPYNCRRLRRVAGAHSRASRRYAGASVHCRDSDRCAANALTGGCFRGGDSHARRGNDNGSSRGRIAAGCGYA